MTDFVYLVGVEDVRQAGYDMKQAADTMKRASDSLDYLFERFLQRFTEQVDRLEALAQDAD